MDHLVPLLIIASVATITNGQGWTQIPRGLTQVSGSLNYIWGVDKNMDIFTCLRPCTGTWKHIPGKLVQVDVDDHEVWGVNKDDNIFMRPIDGSGDWKHINGKLIHVSASGNGYVWGTNRGNQIFKCKKPCTGQWIRVNGGLKQIDGGQREVCGVNRGNSVYCLPIDGSGSWRLIPGRMKQVSTSGTYDLFGVSDKCEIYRCRKPCIGQWIQLGHNEITQPAQCDATVNALFGVDSGSSVWRKDLPL